MGAAAPPTSLHDRCLGERIMTKRKIKTAPEQTLPRLTNITASERPVDGGDPAKQALTDGTGGIPCAMRFSTKDPALYTSTLNFSAAVRKAPLIKAIDARQKPHRRSAPGGESIAIGATKPFSGHRRENSGRSGGVLLRLGSAASRRRPAAKALRDLSRGPCCEAWSQHSHPSHRGR